MLILGVDTSTPSLTVSLINEKKILADYNAIGKLRHSALLMPTVKKALKKIRARIEDIDLYSVGLGPGSFTGLRIGVTAMRALAIALEKPIIGVPTLDAIAHNGFAYIEKKRLIKKVTAVCPILDAKKRQVYACIYRRNGAKIEKETGYLLEPPEKLAGRLRGDILFMGDAVSLYKEQLSNNRYFKPYFLDGKTWLPKASVIANLALSEYQNGRRDNPYDLVPLYLYSRDCNVRYGR